jgi:hypothetical protein
MSQIHGSGAGNFTNTAVVDNSYTNGQGRLHVDSIVPAGSSAIGVVCADNSTTTTLGANGSFVGSWVDVSNYSIIYTSIRTDVSGLDTGSFSLHMDFSQDGVTKDVHEDYYIGSSEYGAIFSVQPSCQYFRIQYYNGADAQGVMRLQTIYRPNYGKPSSHRIDDPINDQNDAELTKSILTAKTDAGAYVNISATNSNNLRTTDAENGLGIAKGDVSGTTFIHKFGATPDFDTGDGSVDIWDGADDSNINRMKYVYSTSADIDSVTSTDSGDTQDIEVQGLDGNYDLVTQTVTLTGSGYTALGSSLLRVFRMKNVNSTDNAGHIYCYVSGATTGGVPNNGSDVRAVIQPENNQTLMALYTIPNGKTGYMRDWFASTAGANKTSNYKIELRARPLNQVFQLKHLSSIEDGGTSYIQHNYQEPEKFSAKTDIVMRAEITESNITEASVSAGFDIVLVDD